MQAIQKINKNREFLLSILKVIIDDINYIKNRHWTITNYVLLLLAAIVGITKLLPDFQSIEFLRKILSIISVCIFFLGAFFIYKFQESLTTYRKGFDITYNKLIEIDEDFKSIWVDHPPNYTSFRKDFISTVLCFGLIQLLGVIFVIWFLYK